MGQTSSSFFQKQEKKDKNTKKVENNLPDYHFDENLPLDLVGYALSLVRLCKKRQSHRLNLPNTYFAKLWKVSVPTVNRKLNQLQEHGVIMRITSEGDKSIEGKFFRTRVIFVKPAPGSSQPQESNLITHKNTIPSELDRTLRRRVNSPESNGFISLEGLKEIPSSRKRKPSRAVKTMQKKFIKSALEKIMEKDELDYRFICLILRQVLGGEGPTIGYYGTKLHLNLRHKPELVVSTLELMMSSYEDIKCPVAWLISEFKSLVEVGPIQKSDPEETIKSSSSLQRKKSELSPQGQRALERLKSMSESQCIELEKEETYSVGQKEICQSNRESFYPNSQKPLSQSVG